MAINKRLAIWASTILILVPLSAAQKYTITDLGVFPGGAVSQGQGVNIVGQVAGYARFSNYNAHGFFWSDRTGLLDLGAIPPETNFSVGQAINSFGDVAGYSDYNQIQDEHAVVWKQGRIHDLGTLPGGDYSQANSINDLGLIAGFADGAELSMQAVIWNDHGSIQNLGTLPGGYYSQGIAINLQGQVAGFSNAKDGQWHGFLWTKSAGMQALPNLGGADSASANGINDLGQVVGGSGSYAVLWSADKNHTAQSLGALGGWSSAFAVNDVSQVVGWSGDGAFIWSPEKGMQNLNQLIPSNSGWTLVMATSINELGQITGEGDINGTQHGFLLTPVSQ